MNLETQIRGTRNMIASLTFRLRDAEVELHHNPTDQSRIDDVKDLEAEIADLREQLDELEYEEEREADEIG